MLTAKQAREMTDSARKNTHDEMIAGCDATLEQIAQDIVKATSQKKGEISYRWNEAKVGSLNALFPHLTQTLYSWDGGEGRNDHITEAGQYVQDSLKSNGYNVSLYSGNLTVKW